MAAVTMSQTARSTMTGDRFVATGLLVLAAVFVALQVIAGEVTPFWGPPAAIYLLLGVALLWRAPRWLLIVAIVLPVLQIGTSMPFMIPGLTHPETPASFLPDLFILVASVVVVVGAAMALRRAEPRERRPLAAFGGLVAAAAVVTSVAAAAGVTSAARQSGDAAVVAANVDYPERIDVQQGAALWVQNQDPFRHTFVVEGTDVHAELPGSAAVRIDADLAPGTYTFFCDVPGHEDAMRGTLSVR